MSDVCASTWLGLSWLCAWSSDLAILRKGLWPFGVAFASSVEFRV